MNAPVDIERSVSDRVREATEVANSWRGRCVNLFARAEALIGQALVCREPAKKPPMLIGKKVDRLQKLGGPDDLLTALGSYGRLLADRTALTHGAGKLWVADKGWLLTLEWLSSRGPERRVFTDEEAGSFHKGLRTAVQQLESALKAEAKSRNSDPADRPSA